MAGRHDILDLKKHMEKQVRVKFSGGREVTGTLKAFDPLVNLVLFGAVETLRSKDPEDDTTTTRDLGVIVCRGTSVTLVCPEEGLEQIDNPFEEPEDDEEEDEEAEEGGDGTAAAAGDAAADA